MTFTEALNTPDLRAEIEAIEDLWVSLDHGDRHEPTLERLLDRAVADFKAKTGLNIDPRH